MANTKSITHAQILENFFYKPEDGLLYRRTHERESGLKLICSISCTPVAKQIVVNGRLVCINRVVWFYVNGSWPDGSLSFKDGDRSNIRIENIVLRKRSGKNTAQAHFVTQAHSDALIPPEWQAPIIRMLDSMGRNGLINVANQAEDLAWHINNCRGFVAQAIERLNNERHET